MKSMYGITLAVTRTSLPLDLSEFCPMVLIASELLFMTRPNVSGANDGQTSGPMVEVIRSKKMPASRWTLTLRPMVLVLLRAYFR